MKENTILRQNVNLVSTPISAGQILRAFGAYHAPTPGLAMNITIRVTYTDNTTTIATYPLYGNRRDWTPFYVALRVSTTKTIKAVRLEAQHVSTGDTYLDSFYLAAF